MYVSLSLSVLHRHTYGWIDQNYSYLNTLSASDALLGDVNRDTFINASDAAFILQYAAAVGGGYKGTLPEFLADK